MKEAPLTRDGRLDRRHRCRVQDHDVLRDAAREVGCEHIEVVVVVEAAQGDQRFGSLPSEYLTPTS